MCVVTLKHYLSPSKLNDLYCTTINLQDSCIVHVKCFFLRFLMGKELLLEVTGGNSHNFMALYLESY